MSSGINNMIQACRPCQKLMTAQPRNPPKLTPIANKVPMQHVGTDLFSLDKEDYLVLVDRYSGFVVSKKLTKTNIAMVKPWFDLLCWPQTIYSDGGSQFRSEFDQFCRKHNMLQEFISPHNPQANGLAESAVKNVKHLLIKCKQENENFQRAFACFRNTARTDGHSPVQLLMGKLQKTNLPLMPEQLKKYYKKPPKVGIKRFQTQNTQKT